MAEQQKYAVLRRTSSLPEADWGHFAEVCEWVEGNTWVSMCSCTYEDAVRIVDALNMKAKWHGNA